MSSFSPTDLGSSKKSAFKRSPREFLDLFLERWWIGALVAIPLAFLLVYLHPKPEPIYTTEVSLLFESKKKQVINIQEVIDSSVQSAAELNTHMEQIRSKTFLEYLMTSFTQDEIKKIEKEYLDPLKPEAPPPPAASIITSNFSVYTRKGTAIICISVSNKNPENAALIANRFAKKYIDYTLDHAASGTTSAIIFLLNQMQEMRAQVEQVNNQIIEFREKNNLASLGENKSVVLQKVSSLGNMIVQAELQQLQLKSLIDKVEEYQKTNGDLTEIPEIGSNAQVAKALETLANLKTQRNLLEERYLRRHPSIRQNDVAQGEARRLLREGVARSVSDLKTKYELNQQHIQRMTVEMAAAESQARSLEKVSSEFKFLEQEAADKSNQYSKIMDRLNETKIASQMENTNVKIFDSAWVPSAPSNSGTVKIAGKAIGVGLLCLLVIPIGIGLLDTRIRTPSHVELGLHQTLLGAVKPLPKLSEVDRASVFRNQKDPAITESYRGIYSEMELKSQVAFPKCILITSSIPAEGKSQFSSNIASVFASHERRTLLIDCDLRHPRLHRYFGKKISEGWVQWMSQSKDTRPKVPGSILKIDTNLDLLPAGKLPDNPTELIDKLSDQDVLAPLVANYDVVIFDTPPTSIFPDALLLARSCHELVFVCKFRTVKLSLAKKALDRFTDSGISILGVVLNQLPERKAASYGYEGYGAQSAQYYKSYKHEDEDEEETPEAEKSTPNSKAG